MIHLQVSHNQELLAPGGSWSILCVAKLIRGGTNLEGFTPSVDLA